MSAILSIALPVFAVIACGLIAGKFSILRQDDVKSLNLFVFNFAMPAALFGLTANAQPLGKADLIFASSYGVAALIVMFGSYFVARHALKLEPQTAGAHAFASTLGNAVFLGLPIALSIPAWAENFVVLMLVEGIMVIAIAAALMSPRGTGNIQTFVLKPFQNPLVFAMTAGLILSLVLNQTNASLPAPINSFLKILGSAAGPTALFSLGLFLATNPSPPVSKIGGRISLIVAMKMVVLPVLTFVGFVFLGIDDPNYLGPAALFTCVPTGVGTFVMANKIGKYSSEVAAAIAISTALSVFTVSLVLVAFV